VSTLGWLISLLWSLPVSAGKRSRRAADIAPPALHEVLESAGWVLTPEMSGAYRPGDIYDGVALWALGHTCFDATVVESEFMSLEISQVLETGVRLDVSVVGVSGGVGLTKKMIFDSPRLFQLPRRELVANADCSSDLAQLEASRPDVSRVYVITEVLAAKVQKQVCGSYDAGAGYFRISADVKLQESCQRASLEPVAVGYKIIPLSQLARTAPEPTPPEPATSEVLPMVPSEPGVYALGREGPVLLSKRTQRIKSSHECGLGLFLNQDAVYAIGDPPLVTTTGVAVVGDASVVRLYHLKPRGTQNVCYIRGSSYGIPDIEPLPSTYDRVLGTRVSLNLRAVDGARLSEVSLGPGDYLLEAGGLFAFRVPEP